MTIVQVLINIIVIAIITFLTRVIPFILIPDNKPIPKYIKYLGNVLPYSVIGMLIVYCLKSIVLTEFPYGLSEGIAIIFVVLMHKWKHNLLFSIVGGTILYMILVRIL